MKLADSDTVFISFHTVLTFQKMGHQFQVLIKQPSLAPKEGASELRRRADLRGRRTIPGRQPAGGV